MAPRKLGSAQASGQALRNKSQILDRSPPPPPTTTKHRNVRHVCPLTCRSAATRSHRRRQVAQIRNTHCTDRYKVISCRLTRPHNPVFEPQHTAKRYDGGLKSDKTGRDSCASWLLQSLACWLSTSPTRLPRRQKNMIRPATKTAIRSGTRANVSGAAVKA